MATEADFDTSVMPFTLHEEGGLSLDPHDAGNWTGGKVGVGKLLGTRYGIACASHPGVDVRHLTLADAKHIYWTEYVVAPHFDRLALPLLLVVFDAGVNAGTGHAAQWLRVAEHETTILAQIESVTAQSLAYHKRLKTWPRYGAVWSARIERCRKQARLLAAAQPVALAPARTATAVPTATVPKPAYQPVAGSLSQLFRLLVEALLHPEQKAVHP